MWVCLAIPELLARNSLLLLQLVLLEARDQRRTVPLQRQHRYQTTQLPHTGARVVHVRLHGRHLLLQRLDVGAELAAGG